MSFESMHGYQEMEYACTEAKGDQWKVFKARTTLKDLLCKFEDVETMKKMMVDSTRSENEMLF